MMPGRVRVERDADQDGERHRPPGLAPHERRHEVLRHVAVDARADRDPAEDVRPDPADDVPHRLAARGQPSRPGEGFFRRLPRARFHPVDPGLDPALEVQPPDDEARHHGNRQARSRVERGDLPPEEAEEEREGDLVHHRGGHEERERHAERHSGRDEANEERHRGAGAERRHDTQERREDGAHSLAFAGEDPPRPLGREEGPHDPDAEDDQGQEHQHLRRLVQEELDRRAEGVARRQPQHRGRQPGGGRGQPRVHEPPRGADEQEEERLAQRPPPSRVGRSGIGGRGGGLAHRRLRQSAFAGARAGPSWNQPRVATQKRQTESMTGTSTSTPTTVARAAPEPGP